MQIHVQNAPFVYNPDTISVGLGFSKGGKKMTVGIQYIKNISQCCVQFVVFFLYPLQPLYITSHQRAGLSRGRRPKEVCFRKSVTKHCMFTYSLLTHDNNTHTAEDISLRLKADYSALT